MTDRESPYNGIETPPVWPPQHIETDSAPLPVPYLNNSTPVIPIDTGRQLFVDDFLIEHSTLRRIYHSAKSHEFSPVLVPETELECNRGHCPVAAPFNDGVWYDAADNRFKMWYHAGWFDGTAMATSTDGLNWEKPELDVIPGTNAVIAPGASYRRDGGLVWLDHQAKPETRFKMFLYFRWSQGQSGFIYTSPDGIHWNQRGQTSRCGDNSSFFYNPFRQQFVFSIRESWSYRARAYREAAEFEQAARWEGQQQVKWARTDRLDQPDPLVGDRPQLYDLNAVAYESILLGGLGVFYGPQNPVCARIGRPKIIDLQLGFSRDGFHWHRPDRSAFIACSRRWGDWNYGYIHAAGGLCLVVGDELWFYYGTFSGQRSSLKPGETGSFEQDNAMYAGGNTGLATLRRDGFASMEAEAKDGFLTTRPVVFGGKFLYVNIDNPKGMLKVEILDLQGQVIEPFSAEHCQPVQTNRVKTRINWQGVEDLSSLIDRPVQFRFSLRSGRLYSFWVSPSVSGTSRGFLGAGGPGLSGVIDL